ncbi:MAG: hypothetical protein M1825_004053 [Sarcosagium campestre]|nr:MAG: hypothetical protein M1825_004053 [Sarcosagium campestre]
MLSQLALALALTAVQLGAANPVPDNVRGVTGYGCKDKYTIDKKESYLAAPKLTSGGKILGCASGCEIGKGDTFEESVTVTVGSNLNFGDIVGAGVNTEVSITKTRGTANTFNTGCPAGAVCRLTYKASMYRVIGTVERVTGEGCVNKKSEPYEVSFPLVSNSDGESKPVVEYAACYDQRPPSDEGYKYADCPSDGVTPAAGKGYVEGQCGMHVVQYQKPDPSKDKYKYDISLFEAGEVKNLIGEKTGADGAAPFDVFSKLPLSMVVTSGPEDKSPIKFDYGDQHFDSGFAQCKFGGYDNGKREGDCGFTC